MTGTETEELLERARRLAYVLPIENERGRAAFEKAYGRWRAAVGLPPRSGEEARLRARVSRELLALDDAVVAADPRVANEAYRPDFLVRRGDEILLVTVKALPPRSESRVRRELERLRDALSGFRADRAILVVPDDRAPRASDVDPRVQAVAASSLVRVIHQRTEVAE